jgi:hypothetical protein
MQLVKWSGGTNQSILWSGDTVGVIVDGVLAKRVLEQASAEQIAGTRRTRDDSMT